MKKKRLKNIVILPARIGSKRIKKKNIKNFLNKPMIYWTLMSLKKTKLFDKIFISTDSKEIINKVKKFGFHDFILRGKLLSNDNIGINPVMIDAIKKISQNNLIENVCCVFPCNPFLKRKDLKKSLDTLEKNKSAFIFPVVKYSHPIERAYYFLNKKFIKRVTKTKKNERTQDFESKYFDSGSFYFAKKNTWLSKKRDKIIGIKTNWWNAVDIDTDDDWKKAELLYKMFKS
jgi:pseudaminic acid cytidylyltransferase